MINVLGVTSRYQLIGKSSGVVLLLPYTNIGCGDGVSWWGLFPRLSNFQWTESRVRNYSREAIYFTPRLFFFHEGDEE